MTSCEQGPLYATALNMNELSSAGSRRSASSRSSMPPTRARPLYADDLRVTRPGVALVRKPVDIAFLESALTRVLRDLEQPR